MSTVVESSDVNAPEMQRQNSILGGEMTEAPETMPDPLHVETVPGAFSNNRVYGRSSTSSTVSSVSSIPPAERKRLELQQRVWRARSVIPKEIPLRVFRDPLECVEAFQILDKVQTEKEANQNKEERIPEGETVIKGALNSQI
jgi:hypothetical protein